MTSTGTHVNGGARLLVVDDEAIQREMLQGILERAGYEVDVAENGAAALRSLDARDYDLVLSDQRMPVADGIELLRHVRARRPDLPVVLMTAYGSVSSAVEAMKLGAADYLTKPFEMDELLVVLDKVLRQRRLEDEVAKLKTALADRTGLSALVGNSPAMQEVYSLIERVAGADVAVLILGESGTGKELVARAIHSTSARKLGPFVALNCAAIPEHLIESEFFGHEKGAFTGAVRTHRGAFEQANGGTLLLDEIGAMAVELQAKLLRVLQEREVQRLGGAERIPIDVRVLAATSEDLEESIAKETFRLDLFYRLNVVPVELPPLRDRLDDIPLLLRHFLARAAARHAREAPSVAPAVVERFQSWHWPGNVRELENCVERMFVLARGPELTVADLPPGMQDGARKSTGPGAGGSAGGIGLPDGGVSIADVERRFIVEALRRSRGAIGPAAKLIDVTYKTMQYRIRKYSIRREEWDA